MTTELRFHRITTVLLTAALLATLTVALTGGQPAEAIDGPVEVVYVATGRNFPDALAGSTLAATAGAPLLTVEPNLPLPDTTITALQSLDPNRIVVLGGPVAVSDAVVGALTAHTRSGSVTRIEGTDRHDTAAAIADALPDKVHDADKLDGLDATELGRVDARRRPATAAKTRTGSGPILSLPATAPRDGYLLITAQAELENATDDLDLLVLVTVDDPGPIAPADFADADALGLLSAPPEASVNKDMIALSTTVPVDRGDHTIYLYVWHPVVGGQTNYRFETINALFTPNGAVTTAD